MNINNEVKTENNDLQMLLLKIRSKYPSLTDAAKKVADFILNRYSDAVYLNISELAGKCGVSESTITKFIKTMGYGGFHELKISLARSSGPAVESDVLYGEISLDDNIESICNKIYYNNMEAMKDSLRILDFDSMDKAAVMVLRARKVDIYGMGSSTVATLNAKMRLYRLGIMCFTYNDPHEQIISASLLKKGDVAIAISNSGKSADVVKAMDIAKQSGASTICITNYDDTPITRYADIKLFTSTKDSEELCESLHARIAELTLIDALYVCIASKMKKQAMSNLYKTSEAIKTHKLT
ncbi:MAG: MurR/RpiR family transcriptional regulator [Clostridia bacterium]|nr:MurR/RpiR family transcriptional regulator [Clostridia bacterium]